MVNREVFRQMPQELLSSILEQLPNPVIAVKANRQVLYANGLARETLGVSAGDVLQDQNEFFACKDWEEAALLSHDPEISQDIFRFVKNGTVYLGFQKHLFPENGAPEMFILSIQEDELAYDIYFDCKNPRMFPLNLLMNPALRIRFSATPRRWSRSSEAAGAVPTAI